MVCRALQGVAGFAVKATGKPGFQRKSLAEKRQMVLKTLFPIHGSRTDDPARAIIAFHLNKNDAPGIV